MLISAAIAEPSMTSVPFNENQHWVPKFLIKYFAAQVSQR
jgi:hypothetical protein